MALPRASPTVHRCISCRALCETAARRSSFQAAVAAAGPARAASDRAVASSAARAARRSRAEAGATAARSVPATTCTMAAREGTARGTGREARGGAGWRESETRQWDWGGLLPSQSTAAPQRSRGSDRPGASGEALTLLNQPAPLDADLPLRVGYGLGRCPDCAGLCGGRAELLDSRHDIDALGERVAEVIEENGHRGIGLRLCGVHEL